MIKTFIKILAIGIIIGFLLHQVAWNPWKNQIPIALQQKQDSIFSKTIIYFELNSWELSDSSKQILDSLKTQITTGCTLYINGYTDDLGSISYNDSLSHRRAETVAQYFNYTGLVIIEGIGSKNPIDTVNTYLNRRVEITQWR